jgi:hypothetical protein
LGGYPEEVLDQPDKGCSCSGNFVLKHFSIGFSLSILEQRTEESLGKQSRYLFISNPYLYYGHIRSLLARKPQVVPNFWGITDFYRRSVGDP